MVFYKWEYIRVLLNSQWPLLKMVVLICTIVGLLTLRSQNVLGLQ